MIVASRLGLVAAIALSLPAVPGLAQTKALETSIALPTISLTFATSYIAEDAGIWEKEGLKVTTRLISGVGAPNAVIAGSIDFTLMTGSTFARAAVRGQRMFAIANVVDRPMVEFVLRKDVAEAAGIKPGMTLANRAKALRGKTIAVDGVQSAVHAFMMLVARKGGVDPEKDIRLSPMAPASMLPALTNKGIDGYAASLPWTTQALARGDAVMLASGPGGDLPEYTPSAYIVLATRPQVCQEQRALCERMARSFKAAAQFINEKPEAALDLLKKRFRQMDPALVAAAFAVSRAATPKDVRISAKSLDNSQQYNVNAGVLKAEDLLKSYDGLFTDEFVK
jgi:ABC-type nitrate/sulfonate/bicarbonate transport system substrate-binding protein